jgi:hypothetical protein
LIDQVNKQKEEVGLPKNKLYIKYKLKIKFMKINRESISKIIKPALNVIIVVSVGTAMFQLGGIYQTSKKEVVKVENPYAHAFSPEEISIAVNESNELIMIERATGKYIVYSDQIGKTIFGMYANRIHQEATNAGK